MKWYRLITAMMVGTVLLGSVMVLPAIAQNGGLRGEVPGSFLIFPEFNITPGPFPGGALGPAVTQIRVCDVQNPPGPPVFLHFNYICPGSGTASGFCPEADSHHQITQHGCIIINVALEGPKCNKGYAIVFAENGAFQPISSNTLIGSYRISGTDGDDAEATNAIAVQSPQNPGNVLGSIDAATGELVLNFGVLATSDYVSLPSILYSDFQAVDAGAVPLPKRTELIVLTPTIKSGGTNLIATLGINFWDTGEHQHSTTQQFICWGEFELEAISPLFTVVGLGDQYGSLQAKAVTTAGYSPAILGVIRETGPGPTLRRMYHVGLKSSQYFPDPNTAPPGP